MSFLGLYSGMTVASYPFLSLDGLDFNATLDPSEIDTYHRPPVPPSLIETLEAASQEGNLPAVIEAVQALRRFNSEHGEFHPGRALLLAIENQHQDVATLIKKTAILDLFLEKAWPINKEFGWDDPPALAYAVEDAELVTWFLAYGADPNAGCFMDKTPLSAAVQYANLSIVQMLFARGGSIEHGQLLHAAVSRKFDDRNTMVEYIISKGASVHAIMYQNRPEAYQMREAFGLGTPLHAAAALGDEETVRVLIAYGARIDIRDSCGKLAVERAISNGHGSVARYLQMQASESL